MQFWTQHREAFRIDSPDLVIDPKKGTYWKCERPEFRYRKVLPLLYELLKEDQFLWCCTMRGKFRRVTEKVDLVEWELNVDESQIVSFYREEIWEDIVHNRSDDWSHLLLSPPIDELAEKIGALVRVPLPLGAAICHGQLPPKYL